MGDGSDLVAVSLMGPTASGKTDLALQLADQVPLEIVSVDSAMVYQGMDIGTAKPTVQLRAQVAHHLIDIRDPAVAYSAADFCADVVPIIRDVRSRGRVPLLVGGTMLYFKALKEGIADLPAADPMVRQQISQFASDRGWAAVHERLNQVDPESAQRIHPNDTQRLQRALEVYEITGISMTELHLKARRQQQMLSPVQLCEIALVPPDRSRLHEQIAGRFQLMLGQGLVEEVSSLFERADLSPELPSMKSVGYRQVWQYLAGELTYDEMVNRAVIATRQLAKRQYTWLRGWSDVNRVPDSKMAPILKILESDSILGL
jgi:tRNA dimethylallyltransferase